MSLYLIYASLRFVSLPLQVTFIKSVRDHEGCLLNTRQIKTLKSNAVTTIDEVSAIHQNEELVLLLKDWISESKVLLRFTVLRMIKQCQDTSVRCKIIYAS